MCPTMKLAFLKLQYSTINLYSYPNIPVKANSKQNRHSRNGPGHYQIWSAVPTPSSYPSKGTQLHLSRYLLSEGMEENITFVRCSRYSLRIIVAQDLKGIEAPFVCLKSKDL